MNEIRTWRERIGQQDDFPLHAPTDVERAMEAEIAELRAQYAEAQAEPEPSRTIKIAPMGVRATVDALIEKHLGAAQATPAPEQVLAERKKLLGNLLDEFSVLPVLWGLNEPGALVRHGDVFKMLVNAGKTYLAAPSAAAPAAPEQVQDSQDNRTYMDDKQAYEWAWDQVKRDCGTNGWTCGEHGNYFGFFLHGWRYGKQYERQGTTAAPASQEGAHAALDEAREEAAKLAIKFTAVPRDCLGPATSHMKAMATVGEKIAAAIRALKTPACAERSGDHA